MGRFDTPMQRQSMRFAMTRSVARSMQISPELHEALHLHVTGDANTALAVATEVGIMLARRATLPAYVRAYYAAVVATRDLSKELADAAMVELADFTRSTCWDCPIVGHVHTTAQLVKACPDAVAQDMSAQLRGEMATAAAVEANQEGVP